MCDHCGCDPHPDHHTHPHTHPHPHTHTPAETRTVRVEEGLLARNNEAAHRNREWLAKRGITAINLISSPGTGKTLLLEKTLERLAQRIPCAVIVGDQQTDRDARRLAGKGAPVVQIETASACHLDAQRVGETFTQVIRPETKLLLIENVGNLICPAAFDLGETFKVALVSVTEGEDKPLKYPTLFSRAPVVVLTKIDLLPHLEWSLADFRQNLRVMCPGAFVFEVSAKSGAGMDTWIEYLAQQTA